MKQRCAVYTRKSTEEGLEQDFNTLDAQREACVSYIASQKSKGWKVVKAHYDDGGYTGGNMERPALKKLIEDIKAGIINIIVVYKIDRLTRSLRDFSRLVDVFDEYNVTFVSVTQSFNTTTSMGRLTLNILLSFAQFEREVMGERTRDKIAASKKKGLWMGGRPPLGYDIENKKLVVNTSEARKVRTIFSKYVEFGTIRLLRDFLQTAGMKSKIFISSKGKKHGGVYYSQGALQKLLRNPIYAGLIRHKDKVYEGLHEEIIPREEWESVQKKLSSNAATELGKSKPRQAVPLKGKIFDEQGISYSPSHTNKRGKRYRYYVSQNVIQKKSHPHYLIARLSAFEVESLIEREAMKRLKDFDVLQSIFALEEINAIKYIKQNIKELFKLTDSVKKVVIKTSSLEIYLDCQNLRNQIEEKLGLFINQDNVLPFYSFSVLYHTKRAQYGAMIIRSGDESDVLNLSNPQLEQLVKGIIWRDDYFSGTPLKEIALREKFTPAYVSKVIHATFDIA